MGFLELKGICKSYGDGVKRTEVLKDIHLSVDEGEFVAILGFSGSGKTTLISLIAGLLQPDDGQILLRGKPVDGPGPDRGVVFQNYSLLPWLSVHDNIALVVDRLFSSWTAQQRLAHVKRYINLVNLTHAAHKRPAELSGGMRQRVSVARALAMNPEMLLLDEPLSALDALTRATLQAEIEKIWQADRKTVVLITNDIDEGILLADRIIPLTPAPQAHLGQAFDIPLPRPRNRDLFNSDPEYRRLRNAVTAHFAELRAGQRRAAPAWNVSLPSIQPKPVTGLRLAMGKP